MAKVLAILANGFEEIEFTTPVDLLRRAGVEVVTASVEEGIHVTGRSGLVMHADAMLDAAAAALPDLVFLPGGPGVATLRQDGRVRALVLRQAEAGGWIGAICAAPAVLHDAGLLRGKRYTAHPSVEAELKEVIRDQRVVVDGKLITSRGAGTALDFGLALVEHLVSKAAAETVAQSICA